MIVEINRKVTKTPKKKTEESDNHGELWEDWNIWGYVQGYRDIEGYLHVRRVCMPRNNGDGFSIHLLLLFINI